MKKNVAVVALTISSLLLTGCASTQFMGDGVIQHEKLLASTPGEYKQATARGALVGTGIGVVGGVLAGSVMAAGATSMMGGLMGVMMPGAGAMILVTSIIGMGTAGAIAGGVIGSQDTYFKKGYKLYQYSVCLQTKKPGYVNINQFSQLGYPSGTHVSVYGKQVHDHTVFFIKPLVAN
jgi:hypothetical protein